MREGIPAEQIVVVDRGENQPLVSPAESGRERPNPRGQIALKRTPLRTAIYKTDGPSAAPFAARLPDWTMLNQPAPAR